MLFDNELLIESLRPDSAFMQYHNTITALDKKITESFNSNKYRETEKLLNDKKKIANAIKKAISTRVDSSSFSDSLKMVAKGMMNPMGYEEHILQPISSVINWSRELGFKQSNGGNITCRELTMLIVSLDKISIHGMEKTKSATMSTLSHFDEIKAANTMVDVAIRNTDQQIRFVKQMKPTKENSTSLFDRSDLYEVVSEGKKTNEIHAIVDQYKDTIKTIDSEVKQCMKDHDYKKAEKLLNDKKKIILTIEKSVKEVEITDMDSFKGNFGFLMFSLPSVIRVINWGTKLDKNNNTGVKEGLKYESILVLIELCGSIVTMFTGLPIGVAMKATYQMAVKPDSLDSMVDTARTHPSKTNLLKVLSAVKKNIDADLNNVKKLKNVKESYTEFSLAVENYIDTVLEDAIK